MSVEAVLSEPPPAARYVRVCCHCRRVWSGDTWVCRPTPPDRLPTHGICRDCFLVHYPEFPLPDGID